MRTAVGEDGALHTIKRMTSAPGRTIRDYIEGRTVRYVHPAAYLLLAVAVCALVARVAGTSTGAAESDRLFVLLMIPFVAGACRVFFWRDGYNYAEHLIAVLFLSAQATLFLAVLLVLLAILPSGIAGGLAIAALVFCAGYFMWGYSQIFAPRLLAVVKASAGLLCGIVLWLAFTFALVTLLRR